MSTQILEAVKTERRKLEDAFESAEKLYLHGVSVLDKIEEQAEALDLSPFKFPEIEPMPEVPKAPEKKPAPKLKAPGQRRGPKPNLELKATRQEAIIQCLQNEAPMMVRSATIREFIGVPDKKTVRLLLDEMVEEGRFIQPVEKVRSGRYGFVGSKAHLDATNHNHHICATPDDVRECWAAIEGIMRAVLAP